MIDDRSPLRRRANRERPFPSLNNRHWPGAFDQVLALVEAGSRYRRIDIHSYPGVDIYTFELGKFSEAAPGQGPP